MKEKAKGGRMHSDRERDEGVKRYGRPCGCYTGKHILDIPRLYKYRLQLYYYPQGNLVCRSALNTQELTDTFTMKHQNTQFGSDLEMALQVTLLETGAGLVAY